MADHGKIGDLLGLFTRGVNIFTDAREGGAAYTADGLDQFRLEVEAALDLDDDHRWLMQRALRVVDDGQVAMGTFVRRWIGIFELAARQIIGPDLLSTGSSLGAVLGDLFTQMRTDGEEVQENRITVGSVVAHGENVGDGTLSIFENDPVLGDDNERINTQDIVVFCRADAVQNGRTAGNELFQTASSLRGNGPRVPVKFNEAFGENRATNHSFEDWAVATFPDSWDVDNGTGGTHIVESLAEFKFGAGSVQFDGDGAEATIGISLQEDNMVGFSATKRLEPLAPYRISIWINTTGGVAGRTITVIFRGTGYVAAAGETISVTAGFPVTFTEFAFWVVMPKDIPSDFRIALEVSGTLGAAENVFFDGLTIQKGTRWGDTGTYLAIQKGATDFIAGPARADQFDVTITNDEASLIQTMLTKLTNTRKPKIDIYPDVGVALPSAVAASAAYAETKAQ